MMKGLEKIEWRESFLSGSQETDKDRKELLSAYNEFIASVNTYPETQDFRNYVERITIQTKQYFKKEEAYVSKYSDLSLEIHGIVHEGFLYELEMYCCDISSHKSIETEEMISFIQTWWVNHTNTHKFFFSQKEKNSKKQLVREAQLHY